jgi:hypothetical protein
MAEDRQQNPDDEQLPGNVSDQNAEEQPPEHEGHTPRRRKPGGNGSDGESGGESSEGSQSTGSPGGAG